MSILANDRIFNAPQERFDRLTALKRSLSDHNTSHPTDAKKSLIQGLRDDLHHTPKVISIFNFKGGVGKTTVAVNVAGMLAELGKRVLVIDCDPQCNLTSFFMPPTSPATLYGNIGADPHAAEGSVQPQDVLKANTRAAMENLSNLNQGAFAQLQINDVKACMKPLSLGIERLEPPKRYFQPIPTDAHDSKGIGDRLLIIPGSSRLYDFDEQLNAMRGIDGELRYKTALCTFVRQAAYVTNADFVIIDCGPSSSMLNKNILISSDYILPPTFCDYFSLASMNSFLTSLLPAVLEMIDQLRSLQAEMATDESSEVYALQMAYGFVVPARPPRVLPFIATNYKVRGLVDPASASSKKHGSRKRALGEDGDGGGAAAAAAAAIAAAAGTGASGGAGASGGGMGAGTCGDGGAADAAGSAAAGGGDGGGGGGGVPDGDGDGTPMDLPMSRFLVTAHANFLLSMRQLCASPSIDPRVQALLCPDRGPTKSTMVIPLVKQTNSIIVHAQEQGMPAVLVHPRGIAANVHEKAYMRARFTPLCEFLISLPA